MIFKSTLIMELSVEGDFARTVKVKADSSGEWVSIGTGRNPDYPRVDIHREDVENVILMLIKAAKSELPSQP